MWEPDLEQVVRIKKLYIEMLIKMRIKSAQNISVGNISSESHKCGESKTNVKKLYF